MIHRRILYLAALAAALTFQITNDNYLARFLLALCAALPLLSLLLTLCALGRCRLVLSAPAHQAGRDEIARWTVSAESPSPLPIPRLTARLEEKNLLTGAAFKRKLTLTGVVRRSPISFPADTAHCGVLEFRAGRLRVWDYLGLFTLIRPAPAPVRMRVDPLPADPGPLNLPEGQGQRSRDEGSAHRGIGEDYDLREYRPGDPMRAVHWKLSSKWDELIVKEGVESLTPLPLLTFDRFGRAEKFDRTLDRLTGYCYALLAAERPHALLWLDGEGEPVLRPVSDRKELTEALTELLSTPLPPEGASISHHPEHLRGPGGPVFCLHITPEEEANTP